MSDAGRIVLVTHKPRLIKSADGWVCLGLHRCAWWQFWRPDEMVTAFGETIEMAFLCWKGMAE